MSNFSKSQDPLNWTVGLFSTTLEQTDATFQKLTPSRLFNETEGFLTYAAVESWTIDADKLRLRLAIDNSIYHATVVIHTGRR